MLSMLAKLLKALNSDASPAQIAIAFSMALIVALTPFFSFHNLIVILLAFVLRVNLGAFFVAMAAFSGLAWFVDPYTAGLGEYLLTQPELQVMWTNLYQSHFWRMTAFNHSLVLGGLIVALIAFIPVFFLAKYLIIKYRVTLLAWIQKFRVVQLLKGTKFYRLYQSIVE